MDNIAELFESTEELRDILRHFYCFHIQEDFETQIGRLAPNFDMLLVFNFGKPVRICFNNETFKGVQIERMGILGPLRKMLNYEMLPQMDLIALVFTMDGFYRIFQKDVDEMDNEQIIDPNTFFNDPLSKDDLSGNTLFDDLWMVVKNTEGRKERVQLLTEFLLLMAKKSDEAVLPLFKSLAYFEDPQLEPVKTIAHELNLSERTIQLRFKKYTGFAPKEMLRFKRFKLVLNDLIDHSNTPVKWMNLVYQYGYHDQSHLIKDFQHYLGTTPKKFIANLKDELFCVSKPGKHY